MTRLGLCKRVILISMGSAFLALLLSLFFPVNALSLEYLELTGRGNSMYPTITDGDRVRVQLCTNGTLINVGDIIAYSIIATGTNPGYMWISHRVTEKYKKDDTWCFKTKGDNNPELDPWEIPEYWLLGIVVSIDRNEHSYMHTETQSQTELSTTSPPSFLLPEGSQMLLLATGSLGIASATAIFNDLKRRRHENILKRANIYSCYSCKYYQIQYAYRLQSINGRIGLRKRIDFSRGFCKCLNLVIEDFPRQNCKEYEPRVYT